MSELNFRNATMKDCELLFKWRNDLATRLASVNILPLKLEDHLKWFENSLIDQKNRKVYIVESVASGVPIGTVRFDKYNSGWELSWTIAPESRGMGFGKEMVMKATDLIHGQIFAKIKRSNISSIRIAEHAGFKLLECQDELTIWRREG